MSIPRKPSKKIKLPRIAKIINKDYNPQNPYSRQYIHVFLWQKFRSKFLDYRLMEEFGTDWENYGIDDLINYYAYYGGVKRLFLAKKYETEPF